MTTNQRAFRAAKQKVKEVARDSEYEMCLLKRQGKTVVGPPRIKLLDKQRKELKSLAGEVAELKEHLGEERREGLVGKLLSACQEDADLEAEVYARFEGKKLPKKMQAWQEQIARIQKQADEMVLSRAEQQEANEKQQLERVVEELEQETNTLKISETELRKNLAVTEGWLIKVEGQRDGAVSEKERLQAMISNLEGESRALKDENIVLNMNYESLCWEKKQLEDSVGHLREEEVRWRIEKLDLQTQRHSLEMTNIDQVLQNVNLEAEKKGLNSQVANLEEEAERCRSHAAMAWSSSRTNCGLMERHQREYRQEKLRADQLEKTNRRLQQDCNEELTRLREELDEMKLFKAQEKVRFQAFLDDTQLERSMARLKLLEKMALEERRVERLHGKLEESKAHLKRSREEKVEVERALKRTKKEKEEVQDCSNMHLVDAIVTLNGNKELEQEVWDRNADLKAAQSDIRVLTDELAAERRHTRSTRQVFEAKVSSLREQLQERQGQIAELRRAKEQVEREVQDLKDNLHLVQGEVKEQDKQHQAALDKALSEKAHLSKTLGEVEEQDRQHQVALNETQSEKARLSERLGKSEARKTHLSSVLDTMSSGLQDLNVEIFVGFECKAQEWLDRIPGMVRMSGCSLDEVVLRMVRGGTPSIQDLMTLVSCMVDCPSFVLAVVLAFVERRTNEGCKGGLVLVRSVELLQLHGQDVNGWLETMGEGESVLENAIIGLLRGEKLVVTCEVSICERALIVRTSDGFTFCWADRFRLLILDGDWYVETESGIKVKLSIDVLDVVEREFPEMVEQALS